MTVVPSNIGRLGSDPRLISLRCPIVVGARVDRAIRPRHLRGEEIVYLDVFCFNETATTEIYTLSLHDSLPIFADLAGSARVLQPHVAEAIQYRRGLRE